LRGKTVVKNNKDNILIIEDLHVEVEGKEILRGVNLAVPKGEVHAVMGPNGSGKSTLANTIMGHPRYLVTKGKIIFDGEDVTKMLPDERSVKGIFLASQYPTEIAGVTLINFIRQMVNARLDKEMPLVEFRGLVNEQMDLLDMDRAFATRYVNQGFSGGEKKRSEILQLAVLRPGLAILDETDSGLDIDALRIVSEGVNRLLGPDMGILLITHYTRILDYIDPNVVNVMMDGKIVKSGGSDLAHDLEKQGYDLVRNNN
jgi:Fe-S cluster assembly ATP-binding protein